MPSTAVASRQNAWKRVAHKYRQPDAAKTARREKEKLIRENARKQRTPAKTTGGAS